MDPADGANTQNRLTLRVDQTELTPKVIERLQAVQRSYRVDERSRK